MPTASETARQQQLRDIAETYFAALRQKDFAAIPYADDVTLRAPLALGGVNHPLVGKAALHAHWWTPLGPALENVEIKVLEHYFNAALTALCTEAEITIHVVSPPAVLRVADRFTINGDGQIIEQENHFDPRDVTNPGWQNA
jgi:hypothetical protein